MSSTNKTANLELSQFLGSDKPAWLTDYNSDMSKIDTGVHNAQSTATSADGKADANTTAIGTLANLTTDVKTNLVSAINEVDGHADTAQGTANDAATNANSALTKASALESALNLDTVTNLTWTTNIGTIDKNTVKCVTNTAGSIAKIYGYLTITNSASSTAITLTSSDTGLRPESAITFNACGTRVNDYQITISGQNVAIPYWGELIYTLNTNGTITLTLTNDTHYVEHDLTFIACVLFIKDFGD